MIRNIIFDFDGTIGDSFPEACKIGSQIANKMSIPMKEEELAFILRHKGISELIKKFNISKLQMTFFIYKFRKEFRKQKSKVKPFKEMIPVLKQLKKKGYNLSIISSNGSEAIKQILKQNDLEIFDFVIKTSLFGKDKTLKKTLQTHKYKKSETIYIGDEKRDIKACREIGLKEIAVSWGFSSRMLLKEENPQIIINEPKEIFDIVKSFEHNPEVKKV